MARHSSAPRGAARLVAGLVLTALLLALAELPARAETSKEPLAAAAEVPPAAAPTATPSPGTTVTVNSGATASASKSVWIVDFSFDPGSITVSSGDTVRWTNNGNVPEGHNVIGGDGLHSSTLHSGQSYSHSFNSAGTFSYKCTLHPTMTAKVIVASSSSGTSGSGSGRAGGGSGSTDTGAGTSGGSPGLGGSVTSGTSSGSTATSSPAATGSSGSLASTGSDTLRLAILGLVLVNVGMALRVRAVSRARGR